MKKKREEQKISDDKHLHSKMNELSEHEAGLVKEIIQLIEENNAFEESKLIQEYGQDVDTFSNCAKQIVELKFITESIFEADEKVAAKYRVDGSGIEPDPCESYAFL